MYTLSPFPRCRFAVASDHTYPALAGPMIRINSWTLILYRAALDCGGLATAGYTKSPEITPGAYDI